MKHLSLIFLLFGLSCTPIKNDKLLSFHVLSDCNLDSWPEVFDPKIVKTHSYDTLIVSASIYNNGCLKFDGDVKLLGNKIELIYWNTTDHGCKEICEYRVTYKLLYDQHKSPEIKLKEKKL